MGNTYEVHEYQKVDRGPQGYAYVQIWRGESFFGMLWAAWQAKRRGAGCVKMEWR